MQRYNSENQESFFAFAEEIWPEDPRKRSPEHLGWLYGDGTSGESNLLLFLHDDRVVGSLGTFPVRWKCGDRELSALWAADFFLLPEYRNKGLGVMLLKEAEKGAEALLTVGMSEQAEVLYTKLRWSAFEENNLYLLLRDSRAILARGRSGAAMRFFVRIGAVPFWKLRKIFGGPRPPLPKGTRTRMLDGADDRIAALWEKWAEGLTHGAVRDGRWSRWRFFEEPSPVHHAVGIEKDNDLVGAVFIELDTDGNGFARGRILDAFWDPKSPELARPLLNEGLDRLLYHSPAYVTAMTSIPEIQEALNRLGFLAVESRPVMYKGPKLPEEARWHVSLADSDSGLGV